MTSAIGGAAAFPSPFAINSAAPRSFGIDVADSARTAQSEPIVARNISVPAVDSVAATPGETAAPVAQSSPSAQGASRGPSGPTASAALALLQGTDAASQATGTPGLAALASGAYQAVQSVGGGISAGNAPRPGLSAVV